MSAQDLRDKVFQEMLKVGVPKKQVKELRQLYCYCYVEKFWLTVGKGGVAMLNTKFTGGNGDERSESFDLSKNPLNLPYR
ncbi:hypothetical protein ACFL2R_03185 [Patescibacteria group bacterium]